MTNQAKIERRAETVIDLLVAQCADLEALLVLARRETAAAEQGDFTEILNLVQERARLGDRLEVHQRQISELRETLGQSFDGVLGNSTAERAAVLISEIQSYDARTRPLLEAAKGDASTELQKLNQTQRSVNAYLQDGRAGAVACDQLC
jgi:hypothetical protein